MTETHDLTIPNHHAHHGGFHGPFGIVAGLSMVWGRGPVARLAADLAEITDEDHVVDVGCGPGTAVREARRRGARATGVDPARVMLKFARALTRNDSKVTWTDGVAEALPLPDSSATMLWSISTVHHWKDIDQGLAEARRVLAPNGRLLAIERLAQPGATGHASHGWTIEQAETFAQLCEHAGFEAAHTTTQVPGRGPVLVVQTTRSAELTG